MLKEQIRQIVEANPDYWAYVQSEVSTVSNALLVGEVPKNRFDMGF